MLALERPSRAFRLLRETGILATVLPELQALVGGGGIAGQGGFVRSLDVLDLVTARRRGNERVAWAALLGEVDPPAPGPPSSACASRGGNGMPCA